MQMVSGNTKIYCQRIMSDGMIEGKERMNEWMNE